MADQKITELNNITGANLADADEFVVVDITADETMAITRAELKLGMGLDQGVATTDSPTFAGLTVDGFSGIPVPLNAEILWPASLTTIPTGWYDTTQRLLSGVMARAILTNNPSAYYMTGGIVPALVLDFASEYYRTSGTDTTLGTATTYTGASLSTMTDSDGLVKWSPHNLLLNSATMSTQNITSLAVQYTLAFTGTGTVTLTGTSTAGPLVGTGASDLVSLDFTPTAGTLTLTVSGSVTLARVYRSDLGGMVDNPATASSYVPTTAAAVYLPRVGNHVYNGTAYVNEGLFLESEARTNLLTYSEDFTDASWSKTNTATLALDAIGPDGVTNSAVTLVDSNAGGTGNVVIAEGVTVATSTPYTASAYLKAGQLSWARLQLNSFTVANAQGAYFDLSTGSIGSVGADVLANIEDVGGGWYRCSITFTTDVADTLGSLLILPCDANNDVVVALDGTSSILIYGAQFEAGSTPSSYIPTAGSTVTRAAETLTVAAANMPWPTVVETTGTELVTNGTFDTDISGWTLDEQDGSIVWDASGAISLTCVSASIYATQSFTTVIGGLYRVNITGPASGNIHLAVGTAPNSQANAYYATTGAKVITFIATATTTYVSFREGTVGTTLVYDISVKEINPLAVSIQMDGLMTYADENQTFQEYLVNWDADASNLIQWRMSTNSTNTGQMQMRQTVGGVNDQLNITPQFTPDINVPFNLASRHGSTFINGALDGTAVTANLTPTALPDLSATDFEIGSSFMGNIGKVRVWADDIGDTGIAEAST